MTDLEFENEELRIQVAELQQDLEDFCYVTVEFLGIMGIDVSQLRNGIETRKVIKAIKSKLLMIATDEEGFASLFSHFAPEALRVGEKYEELSKIVTERKHKEKGICKKS